MNINELFDMLEDHDPSRYIIDESPLSISYEDIKDISSDDLRQNVANFLAKVEDMRQNEEERKEIRQLNNNINRIQPTINGTLFI